MPPTSPIGPRFWAKVNRDGPVHPTIGTKCWLWTGAIQGGYGGFTDKQRKLYAHRVAWELVCGQIPCGLKVLHTCDNPLCVRPTHLFLGTNKDNSQDMVGKDRHPRGERQGAAVLDDQTVLWLREVYMPRHPVFGCHALARHLNVSPMTVSRAIRGKCWGHL